MKTQTNLMKETKYTHINLEKKLLSYGAFLFNLVSLIFGGTYLGTITHYTIFWDIGGIIFLITLCINFLLIYVNSVEANNKSILGRKLSKLGYLYLAYTIFAMLGMFLGNFLYSISYSCEIYTNIGALMITYFSFFGILGIGLLIGYLNIRGVKYFQSQSSTYIEKTSSGLRIIKLCIMVLCYLILLAGLYFAIITLFGADLGYINGAIGIFIAQFDLFFAFIILSVALILLKLKDKKKSPKSYYGTAILGLVLAGIFIAPLAATPYSIATADDEFATTFGSNWRGMIPSEIEANYFLQTPFSIPEYFLGMFSNNYRVNANILFYDGEGIQLYFDVYTPLKDGSSLPGNNSVIIRIHGGGWTAGDKGFGNMMQMNKYFAAQGYIVFDIQYGLHEDGWEILPTPEYVRGNFTVDDMVRHIGIFTKYLASHAADYQANLDSVFISGGSAGGHLTCAVGLGISSGNYSALFGTNLTIKGLIPFYPANGHAARFGGSPEFINPDDYLVDSNSPPCLVFQGLEDGLVHPSISQELRDAYIAAGNPKCAVLYFPFAGHAADLYFTGYYNQVFLYYMERFLYLCAHNFI